MRSGIDWLPYAAPIVAFSALLALEPHLPQAGPLAWLALRLLVPAALLVFFALRGAYPELRGYRLDAGALGDALVGLGIAALWVAPYLLWPELRPVDGAAFNPAAAGESTRSLALVLRLVGFAAVTPFAEELLVRSFLMRFTDVYDTEGDFRDVPIGTFAWRSFWVTVVWFTFTHAQWEWPVAFAAGVAFNLWLYKRKSIPALVVTHAATNAALFAFVALEAFPELWFFL